MPRPQKPPRPTAANRDPEIEARTFSRFERQEFLRRRSRSSPKSSDIDISAEEISRIVEVMPVEDAFNRKAFHWRLVQCLRGFAGIERWAKIIPWTHADAAHVKQLGTLANALNAICLELSDATKHLLDHIGQSPPMFSVDLIEFAQTFNEVMTFASKYAPLPDEGRPRRNIKARFLAPELIEIWQLFTGEPPKRSTKLQAGGSPIGEFGVMSERVLELMLAKGLISEGEVHEYQKSILARLDRSKSRLL
jgi:hypothetical protein